MMAENREARYKAVADVVLSGIPDDTYRQGLERIKILVDGWYDGAGGIDPDDLFHIGLADLKKALADVPPSKRLQKLDTLVIEHKVETLSARAFRLACRVVDKEMSANAAHADAQAIAREIDGLLPQVHQLKDIALKERSLRELADADLECRYIQEGQHDGLTSIRLNQYMHR